jgi:integrase/recombinase XerD
MTVQQGFRSGLGKDARRYIAHKQTLGRSFEGATRVLASMDTFLSGMGTPAPDLTAETFTKWTESLGHISPNTKLARMRVMLNFCIYRRRSAPECFVPDPSQFPRACPLLRPYIFSESDVARLLGYCRAQPEDLARSPLRWASTHLAITLLYATGMRRGELLRLAPSDYDPSKRTLLIQASKFHKSRLLPLPDDLAGEVERFLLSRHATYPAALPVEPILWSRYGHDRSYTGMWLRHNVNDLLQRAGIRKTEGCQPRIHDFRHSFAVNALIRWYRAGANVQAKLPLLANWLGHVSILSTYQYLHFVDELRQSASDRFTEAYGGVVVPGGGRVR